MAGIVHYERRKSSTDSWRKKLKLKNHTWDQIQLFDILRQVVSICHNSILPLVLLFLVCVSICVAWCGMDMQNYEGWASCLCALDTSCTIEHILQKLVVFLEN